MTETTETAEKPAQVEVETVGIDEMVRQNRVRSIFEARKACRERRTRAKTKSGLGEPGEWSVVYRTALESYIREVEPLLAQTEEGIELWKETDFGALDLRPWHEEVERTNQNSGRIDDADIHDTSNTDTHVPLKGLGSLFEVETPLRASFEVRVPARGMSRGLDVQQVTVERDIPMQVLDSMLAAVNGYIADIGFGIEVGKAQQHTKLDDDLLEEVEQWRRENL